MLYEHRRQPAIVLRRLAELGCLGEQPVDLLVAQVGSTVRGELECRGELLLVQQMEEEGGAQEFVPYVPLVTGEQRFLDVRQLVEGQVRGDEFQSVLIIIREAFYQPGQDGDLPCRLVGRRQFQTRGELPLVDGSNEFRRESVGAVGLARRFLSSAPRRLRQHQEPRVRDQVQAPELRRSVPAQPAVSRPAFECPRPPA